VPAAWVLAEVGVLAFGPLPRAAASISWAAAFLLVNLFGEVLGPILRIDYWIAKYAVPYPNLPMVISGEPFTSTAVLIVIGIGIGIAAALTTTGLVPSGVGRSPEPQRSPRTDPPLTYGRVSPHPGRADLKGQDVMTRGTKPLAGSFRWASARFLQGGRSL
jgi:hypothetical protein